jgi:hypothetical protein
MVGHPAILNKKRIHPYRNDNKPKGRGLNDNSYGCKLRDRTPRTDESDITQKKGHGPERDSGPQLFPRVCIQAVDRWPYPEGGMSHSRIPTEGLPRLGYARKNRF